MKTNEICYLNATYYKVATEPQCFYYIYSFIDVLTKLLVIKHISSS